MLYSLIIQKNIDSATECIVKGGVKFDDQGFIFDVPTKKLLDCSKSLTDIMSGFMENNSRLQDLEAEKSFYNILIMHLSSFKHS